MSVFLRGSNALCARTRYDTVAASKSTQRSILRSLLPCNLRLRRGVARRRNIGATAAHSRELETLGLSPEEISTVEGVIARTGATDIGQAVKTLTAFVGSTTAARSLVARHPSILCCQLQSWVEFLTAFGLTKAQVQHVLCQTPEALIEGDLLRAGEAILVFRRLGLNDYAAAQLVTYYPQLLSKDELEIRKMVSMLSRYQGPIDTIGM